MKKKCIAALVLAAALASQVERIFPPEKSECREMFDGSPDVLADKMYHVLRETKFI